MRSLSLDIPDGEGLTEDSASQETDKGGDEQSGWTPWEDLTHRVRMADTSEMSRVFSGPGFAGFFDSVCRGLHRNVPRHVMIVHDRGVGEQIALLELAGRAVRGAPAFLRGRQLMGVNCRHVPREEIGRLIDTVFGRLGRLDQAVVCFEGFANLLRQQGARDWRSIITSLLIHSRCRVVGLMGPHEFEELIAADADLREMFTVVHLPEPEPATAIELVRHFAAGMQAQYRLHIEEAAIHRAVTLAGSYILHERLPYKAVKALRAVCDDVEYDRMEGGVSRDRVTESDVVAKIAHISGVPEATLSGVGEGVDYRLAFSELVVGQDHAVREVATELGLIKAGFIDAGKPASVMMFIGQTGTGKTELAKVLARFYSSSRRLKTFTLGNFSEPHSVSGIIGVPPGYVGHEQGGRLVNELNADPYGVFLLDEADKAHPDVMQPFLNLFDEGWICDQRGVKAYADRAIFILTTNVGQRQIADMCKNGKSVDEITSTMKDSLARIRHTKSNRPVFTPEFMSRIKRMVVFRSLDAQAMLGICRRLIGDLQSDWKVRRQKTIQIPDPLVEAIARKAFALDEKSQGKEGGRIVRKLLADIIESRIQTAISNAPARYRSCHVVSLQYSPSEKTEPMQLRPEAVEVSFAGGEGAE